MMQKLRSLIRSAGYDVIKYSPQERHPDAHFIKRHGIEAVIDVGANEGQYGRHLRRWGFKGDIYSFEPNHEAFCLLEKQAANDPRWRCFNCALGEKQQKATLNVSQYSTFNSILQTTEYAESVDPKSLVQSTEQISIETLDSLWNEMQLDGRRVYLKADTQGYERFVLMGAERSLNQISGIQLELSLRPLYSNQPRIEEMILLLREYKFELFALWPVFVDPNTGQIVEMDGLFARS